MGRESGAGKPLLKTIFQVNLKLFQPSSNAKKTILMFVFRDRTKTPLEKLKETWEMDLEAMWSGLAKPAAYEESSLRDFFELQYAALSNYEDKQEDFAAESIVLRRRFTRDAPEDESLLRADRDKLPGQALGLSMVKAWEVIKDNKDLNLPAHRVMVATIRCKEIASEKVAAFGEDERWGEVVLAAGAGLLEGFGVTVAAVMNTALAGYDEEARYFDTRVSGERRASLVEDLCEMVLPVYKQQLVRAVAEAMRGFTEGMKGVEGRAFTETAAAGAGAACKVFEGIVKTLYVPGTPWESETLAAKENLEGELRGHVETLKGAFLKRLAKKVCDEAEASVTEAAAPLLETPPEDMWARLRTLVGRVREEFTSAFDGQVAGYDVSEDELAVLHVMIDDTVTSSVNKMAKEAANTILPRMKDAFSEAFHKDGDGMPRTWTPSVDIARAAKEAKRAASRLLGQFTVLAYNCTEADVEAICGSIDAFASNDDKGTKGAKTVKNTIDIQTTPSWPNVDTTDVLLTPSQVRSAWRQFSSDVALSVQQAVATQEANRLARNRMPPVWAIVAMFVLGFNELVSVLRNPLWLLTILVLLAFARTVYEELDVEAEMQNGLLPGVMVLSGKFVPTMKKVLDRTIEAAKKILEGPPESEGEDATGAGETAESPGPAGIVRNANGRVTGAEGIRRRGAAAESLGVAVARDDPMDIDSSARSVSRKDD